MPKEINRFVVSLLFDFGFLNCRVLVGRITRVWRHLQSQIFSFYLIRTVRRNLFRRSDHKHFSQSTESSGDRKEMISNGKWNDDNGKMIHFIVFALRLSIRVLSECKFFVSHKSFTAARRRQFFSARSLLYCYQSASVVSSTYLVSVRAVSRLTSLDESFSCKSRENLHFDQFL